MRKNISKILLVPVLATASFVASAADGTINFTGTITDTACTVDAASANQTVPLGTVARTGFSAVGSTSAATKFTIGLTACPASVTAAKVKFDGRANSTNSNLLALNSDQTATNVGIGIYEQDGSTLIPLGTQSASKTLSSTAANALTYVAKYYAVATPVGSGSANSTANFSIVYN
ncbi:fimbrial protein [Rosenbergiella sp. S61]|uniref:Fimbrial protein n=1 Tax=Rosenbergiella gaditana TaxID=2726987 RepID=A0ABS5SVM0_9GAMM|nr:fimbrial protein [Rosenbergiella gaditana]MBT0724141.1 fimbrial protein [Rosenbergiella gaditana]